jgi:hypothetical protein
LSYQRPRDPTAAANILEHSPDLITWSPAASSFKEVSVTQRDEETEVVTLQSLQPIESASQYFWRLIVRSPDR